MKNFRLQSLKPASLTRLTVCILALNALPSGAATPPRIVTGPVAGTGPHLKGFEYADREFTPFANLFAYNISFQGGVSVAAGDVNGDGVADMVVGTASQSSHVKVFDGQTLTEIRSFFAFPLFSGGVHVATGDVNNDGYADIIVSTATTAAHVKVFSGATGAEIASFLPYAVSFTGGVTVASGDVNGDGLADIVTGSASLSTHVKVFLAPGFNESASFLAYPSSTGVYVAAGDVNGDGYADIITGSGPGTSPHVKVFSGTNQASLASFFAYALSATQGVRVASADMNGDGTADIITSLGSGSDLVRIFSPAAALLDQFNAYNNSSVGVFVAAYSTPATPLPQTALAPTQKVRINTSGEGYQELVYNYHTSELMTSSYSNTPGTVSYTLPAGQWVGIFHYDYGAQAFTQAIYQMKEPL